MCPQRPVSMSDLILASSNSKIQDSITQKTPIFHCGRLLIESAVNLGSCRITHRSIFFWLISINCLVQRYTWMRMPELPENDKFMGTSRPIERLLHWVDQKDSSLLPVPRVKKRSVKTNVLWPRVSMLAALAKRRVWSYKDFSMQVNDEPNPISLVWPT